MNKLKSFCVFVAVISLSLVGTSSAIGQIDPGPGTGTGGGGPNGNPTLTITAEPNPVLWGFEVEFERTAEGGAGPKYQFYELIRCAHEEDEEGLFFKLLKIKEDKTFRAERTGEFIVYSEVTDKVGARSERIETPITVTPPDNITLDVKEYRSEVTFDDKFARASVRVEFQVRVGDELIGPFAKGRAIEKMWKIGEEEPEGWIRDPVSEENVDQLRFESPLIVDIKTFREGKTRFEETPPDKQYSKSYQRVAVEYENCHGETKICESPRFIRRVFEEGGEIVWTFDEAPEEEEDE
jgi:hypothetical protein